MLLASGGWGPETLLNILPCTGRPYPREGGQGQKNLTQLKWSILPKSRRPAFQEMLMMVLLVNFMHHLTGPQRQNLATCFLMCLYLTLDEMKI